VVFDASSGALVQTSNHAARATTFSRASAWWSPTKDGRSAVRRAAVMVDMPVANVVW
jgi:hypothetical protein